ncbi:hypothetical protein [Candidatus Enterovibrio altilux]
MVRVKKLLEGTLRLRDHNAQINAAYAIIKFLSKLTRPDMSKIKASA